MGYANPPLMRNKNGKMDKATSASMRNQLLNITPYSKVIRPLDFTTYPEVFRIT